MNNQIIFITGGTSGIGKALVEQLQANNTVITCGRNQQKLDELQQEYPTVDTIRVDIGKQVDVLNAKEYITNKYGKLDVLINNAGIGTYIDLNDESQELDFSDFQVNLFGTIQTSHLLLPLLRKSEQASIAVVSSILAKVPVHNIPFYSASKAAIHSYCLSLRNTLQGINVVEVLPPIVDTPMTSDVENNQKMNPSDVAQSIITGIEKGKKEVYPGMAKAANIMSKVYYSKIESLMNAA